MGSSQSALRIRALRAEILTHARLLHPGATFDLLITTGPLPPPPPPPKHNSTDDAARRRRVSAQLALVTAPARTQAGRANGRADDGGRGRPAGAKEPRIQRGRITLAEVESTYAAGKRRVSDAAPEAVQVDVLERLRGEVRRGAEEVLGEGCWRGGEGGGGRCGGAGAGEPGCAAWGPSCWCSWSCEFRFTGFEVEWGDRKSVV